MIGREMFRPISEAHDVALDTLATLRMKDGREVRAVWQEAPVEFCNGSQARGAAWWDLDRRGKMYGKFEPVSFAVVVTTGADA